MPGLPDRDRWLTDFAMPLWWQPTVFAAMLGLSFAVREKETELVAET